MEKVVWRNKLNRNEEEKKKPTKAGYNNAINQTVFTKVLIKS